AAVRSPGSSELLVVGWVHAESSRATATRRGERFMMPAIGKRGASAGAALIADFRDDPGTFDPRGGSPGVECSPRSLHCALPDRTGAFPGGPFHTRLPGMRIAAFARTALLALLPLAASLTA